MKIGLDIMGGDYAPKATILGAIQAHKKLEANQQIVLIGDKEVATSLLKEQNYNPDFFEFVHTTEVIGMGEHPTKAIVQKANSSISVGFNMLKEGTIDSFASAGNTGAMLVGAMFSVKAIPGVLRPAISTVIPKVKGGFGIMLDAGANADCKPEHLLQFGIMGSLYSKYVYQIEKPKVGLMNLGEEEEKGNKCYIWSTKDSSPELQWIWTHCEVLPKVERKTGPRQWYGQRKVGHMLQLRKEGTFFSELS
jgi:glycerol-3-phosphate acyltransferase PlsX